MATLLRTSAVMLAIGLAGAQAQVVDPVSPGVAPYMGAEAPVPDATRDAEPQAMPRIMNDTEAYCAELREDIARIRARRKSVSDDVALLTREGERMCLIGHIRPGIYRLRTALKLLRHGE